MSTGRRVLETTALVLSGSMWSRLTGAVVVLLLARRLGAEALGTFSFAQAWGGILLGLAEVGLAQVVVREIARGERDPARVVGNAMLVRMAAAVPLALLAAWGLAALVDDPLDVWMSLAAATWILLAAATPATAIFRAEIRMGIPVAVNAVANGSYAIVAVALLLVTGQAVWVYVAFAVTNAAAVAVLAWLGTRRLRPQLVFDRATTRALLVSSLPLALNALLMVVHHRIDQVMLQAYLGPDEVGRYAAAVKLVELWNILPLAVMAGVFPVLARHAATDRARYLDVLRRTTQLLAVAILGVLPFVAWYGGAALRLLFGPGFEGAAPAFTILTAAGLFLYFLFVFRDALVSEHRETTALSFAVVTMTANVALNVVLIPPLGLVGAAWATFGALACVIGLAAVLPATRTYARLAAAATWRPLAATTATAGVLRALQAWPAAGVLAGLLVYPGLLIALGAFTPADRELLAAVTRRGR